jgi:hypothetical protein
MSDLSYQHDRRGVSVDTDLGYGLDNPMLGVWFPARAVNFSPLHLAVFISAVGCTQHSAQLVRELKKADGQI